MSQKNRVIFWLARADLPYFIEPHEFYVAEAKKESYRSFMI